MLHFLVIDDKSDNVAFLSDNSLKDFQSFVIVSWL